MYRLCNVWTRTFLLVVGLTVAVGVGALGCRSAPPPKPEASLEGKSDPQILYLAVVETFEERGIPIDVASEKFMIVTSKYRKVSERLRRRFTARIVRMRGGATALRIKAEHERRHGRGDDVVWKTVDSDILQERAEKEELELARAAEKRFHRWKAYAKSQSD